MARKIKSDKSLLAIAREYGVSVADLRRLNSAAAQKSGKTREVRIPNPTKKSAANTAREKRGKSGKATGSDFMAWIRGETDAGGRAKPGKKKSTGKMRQARTKTQGVKRTPVKATRSQEVFPATGLGAAKEIASKAKPLFKTCATCPSKGQCRKEGKCLKKAGSKTRRKGADPLRVMNPRRK